MAEMFDPHMWSNGPTPGGFYQHRGGHMQSSQKQQDPKQHTTRPIVTGTSVLAIKCSDGVIMAADTLGSYGSLARFRDQRRIAPVGNNTIVGGSGDMADYEYIKHVLDDLVINNSEWDDGHEILARSVHTYMTRIMYGRRSKMNPLWNTLVVGGFSTKGDAYLGYVDKIGVAYQDTTIATGYGAHIALPIMRSAIEANPAMTIAEATPLLERCLKVMFYRDARSLNKYQIATVTKDGNTISEPQTSETNWDIADFVRGYE
eukprot:m.218416 g.218416  ORF g.218416 m.218416 type:complete len:260 (-) comp19154_c0_seq1:883-1662(-)